MATVSIYHDTRGKGRSKDKRYPLKFAIRHNYKSRFIATGIKCASDQFDIRLKKNFPEYISANDQLSRDFNKIERFLADNSLRHSMMNIDMIMQEIEIMMVGEKAEPITLYKLWQDEVLELRELGRHSYALDHENAIRSVKKFAGSELFPDDITAEWLRKYERWNLKRGNKLNGFAPYLRCLRRMLNISIEKGFLTLDKYPFGRAYKIKRERTKKRAVKKSVMDTLMTLRYESGSSKWHHHNYLVFMYHARGMNFVDLAHLTVEQAQDRIRYTRRKTKKDYNIGHTAVTRTITDHYAAGKKKHDYLFPIMTGYSGTDSRSLWHYKTMLRDHNEALKEICKDAGLDVDMTSYVIRHSWATILKKQGVSTSLISEGMGHSTEEITQTYLDEFEDSELDKLNDYL